MLNKGLIKENYCFEVAFYGRNLPRLDTETTHRSTKDWEINYRIFTPAGTMVNNLDRKLNSLY